MELLFPASGELSHESVPKSVREKPNIDLFILIFFKILVLVTIYQPGHPAKYSPRPTEPPSEAEHPLTMAGRRLQTVVGSDIRRLRLRLRVERRGPAIYEATEGYRRAGCDAPVSHRRTVPAADVLTARAAARPRQTNRGSREQSPSTEHRRRRGCLSSRSQDRSVSIEVDADCVRFFGIDVPDQAHSRAEILIELTGHFLQVCFPCWGTVPLSGPGTT